MIPAWVMIATVILVCITVVVCFAIWASRGADVDEVADDLESTDTRVDVTNAQLDALKARVENLSEVVAKNALVLEAVRKKLGGEALQKLGESMGGAPAAHGIRRHGRLA